MYWRKPGVKSNRIDFYFNPSKEQIASLLVTHFEDFDFSYVAETSSETQVSLLYDIEDIYDRFPETHQRIFEILENIPIGTKAKCQFIIGRENYEKFPMIKIDRVPSPHFLLKMAEHYQDFPDAINEIMQRILLSKGQGTKIAESVKVNDSLISIFEYNIPFVVSELEHNGDAVTIARNISHTKAPVSKEDYNTLETSILANILGDSMDVSSKTVQRHMKNIKKVKE